ncbi:MAG: hypothetical protein WCT01_01125 [Candidatus Shapirobacteria bacterium]
MALTIQVNQAQLLQFLNRQQSNRQFNRLLEVSFTLTIITLFIIFAVRPSVVTIASLFGEVKAKQEFSSLMKTQINKVVEAQDIFAQIQSRSQSLEKALGFSPNYVYSKNQILWLASTSQINIESINYVPPLKTKNNNPSTPLKSIGAKFSFKGTYESALNFLSQLTRLKKVNQITGFNILLPIEQKKSSDTELSSNLLPLDQLQTDFSITFNYWSPNE